MGATTATDDIVRSTAASVSRWSHQNPAIPRRYVPCNKPRMTSRSLLLSLSLCLACTSEPGGSTGDASTGEATDPSAGDTTVAASDASSGGTGSSTGEPTGGPDPAYRRDCQPRDFVCDDWGCEEQLVGGECYKRCTPDAGIGEPDSECDEPERPFCSQSGRALGGDFNCNGCAHVCASAAFNDCDEPVDACE